ncbi:NAD(P)-binding protein [Byssothecium circinans]|uniref:NAD(P)-binding protein n=1 Tax=Byssothecium circinans TaxID=147558 RepID=A0A6A5U7W4_9PLEO|nr:NAD(P)-binding protein [Byssothecium circinans]
MSQTPVIAVAGGSGGLGRAIVDALRASGEYDVVVLSRSLNSTLEKETGARVLAADYTKPAELVKLLEDNKVSTVIASLAISIDPTLELNLIEACERSGTTERYIPGIWSAVPAKNTPIAPLAEKFLRVTQTLEKTNLEWTTIHPGLFMDFYVPGLPSSVSPTSIVVDVLNNAAGIPGTGNTPISFTYTRDVGKYVTALLGKVPGTWAQMYFIAGDNRTWNEVVALAKEGKGVKFDVRYDSLEMLEKGEITELPSHEKLYEGFGGGERAKGVVRGWLSTYGLWMESGDFEYRQGPFLNEEFGDVKALRMDEAWGLAAGKV